MSIDNITTNLQEYEKIIEELREVIREVIRDEIGKESMLIGSNLNDIPDPCRKCKHWPGPCWCTIGCKKVY